MTVNDDPAVHVCRGFGEGGAPARNVGDRFHRYAHASRERMSVMIQIRVGRCLRKQLVDVFDALRCHEVPGGAGCSFVADLIVFGNLIAPLGHLYAKYFLHGLPEFVRRVGRTRCT